MKKLTFTLVFLYGTFAFAQEVPEKRTVDSTKTNKIETVVIVGSRNVKRTVVNSPVAIDVIDIKSITTQSGKIEINELLQYAAPSFNANKQSGSDGADHVDPASLRGMGPDQTLVLINGKRRHQSSLINLFGTRGRGNTGTDLNAIPATSIKRIEILRDGAAAQYGSDAIAGVINIVLNDNINELTGAVTYGAFNTNAKGDFPLGTANTKGFRLDENGYGNSFGKNKNFDGNSLKAGLNYGIALGKNGGFVNFTGELLNKEKTLRPGFDFRKGFGEAAVRGLNFMANLSIPISTKTDFYAFAGSNYRDTDAYAFTRNDGARVVESIYPGGFTPRITSVILDNSIALGLKTKYSNGWKMDFSNTLGNNSFHYNIKGTLNASLGAASPTEFDAGGHKLLQNTTNLDFSKNYSTVLEGFNLALGSEFRIEKFNIFAGETGSYATYDINGDVVTDPTTQTIPTDPISGDPRPGGSQGFPGYSPSNEVNEIRTNFSLYADTELDITKAFMLSTAVRFENYSDFGKTLNGKLASRLKLTNQINLRGSISTGFRAPSLAQIYYNTSFTNFSSSGATEVLLAGNESPVTKAFGIGKLNQEKAINTSIGITGSFGNFTTTIDAYMIRVKDRIVLTGYFDATSLGLNVDAAQFFTNGVDTKTKGVDIVLSWKKNIGASRFGAALIGNINDMEITNVKNNGLDEQTFFGERDKAFLLASAPANKFGLNLNYGRKWFDSGLAFTRFSEVKLLDYQVYEDVADYGGSFQNQIAAATDTYGVKIVTDLTLGFKLNKSFKLTVGANNLLNIYPDQQDDWVEAGGYWDSVQMGFGGAYYYTRLGFKF
ncbi:TonB-dependent receptor [Flavobacterium sp. F372]|uniref:TonB-dependent receptor n=1 Tax=Flavobacterium bernardetii TaxID=2813823 RepID=A0ABR7J288_9FLAO|nr:TonB-dependent receptor [Flavobacterium bernardetii]MBC5836141.1 TonB-dependent receptor [Flavobacterium bernardetii]NHF71326.1 TonB-dependent receptor [Flavobacterium bernardetii]